MTIRDLKERMRARFEFTNGIDLLTLDAVVEATLEEMGYRYTGADGEIVPPRPRRKR